MKTAIFSWTNSGICFWTRSFHRVVVLAESLKCPKLTEQLKLIPSCLILEYMLSSQGACFLHQPAPTSLFLGGLSSDCGCLFCMCTNESQKCLGSYIPLIGAVLKQWLTAVGVSRSQLFWCWWKHPECDLHYLHIFPDFPGDKHARHTLSKVHVVDK